MMSCYAIPAVQWGECSNSAVGRMRNQLRPTFCALRVSSYKDSCLQTGDVTWNRL